LVRVSIGGGRIGRAGMEAVDDWDDVLELRCGSDDDDESELPSGVSEWVETLSAFGFNDGRFRLRWLEDEIDRFGSG
jgi:hypothetical protein